VKFGTYMQLKIAKKYSGVNILDLRWFIDTKHAFLYKPLSIFQPLRTYLSLYFSSSFFHQVQFEID
jgi:hypothetical protein